MSGICLVRIFMGESSSLTLVLCLSYLCTIAALNQRGGKPAKYISYFIAGTLSIFLLVAALILAMPLFSHAFDLVLFLASMLLGTVGVVTIFTLRKINAKNI